MRANLLGSLPALDPALAWLIAIAIAVLLLASALHKLRDLPGFEAVLSDYDLLPARATGLVPVVARTVVAAELILAVALLVPDAAPWRDPRRRYCWVCMRWPSASTSGAVAAISTAAASGRAPVSVPDTVSRRGWWAATSC